MADERVLDLRRGESVTGDVHHVVDATEQPDITVAVALGAVAGEVLARESTPVGLLETLGVAVDAAGHAGPRRGDDEVPALAVTDRLALVVDDVGADAREGRH